MTNELTLKLSKTGKSYVYLTADGKRLYCKKEEVDAWLLQNFKEYEKVKENV